MIELKQSEMEAKRTPNPKHPMICKQPPAKGRSEKKNIMSLFLTRDIMINNNVIPLALV